MLRRHAAALLCGAAAVHFLGSAFHVAAALGWRAPGDGRTLLLVGVAPLALVLTWVVWDRSVGFATFMAGGAASFAILEWWALPAFGYDVTSVAAVIALFAGLVVRRSAPKAAPQAPPRGGFLLGAALGLLVGFSLAIIRPFLFEHVVATRPGVNIAVLTAMIGALAGGAMGQLLKARWRRGTIVTLTVVFGAIALATTALLLPRSIAGLVVPLLSGAWSATWWGRSILASWAMLGMLTVAFGFSLPLLDRWRAVAMFVLGICGGTRMAERTITALDADREALRTVADRVARHPPMQSITAAAIDPDGIWTRYRTRTALELESVAFRHGVRVDRGELWHNLEAAEVEPAAGSRPFLFGRSPGELGFGRQARLDDVIDKDVVVRSLGFAPAGIALQFSYHADRGRSSQPGSVVTRVWCDPRSLTPEGVRTLLATWRAVAPDGRFVVLADGYNGPLLGLVRGGDDAHFHIAEHLTLFEAPIASAFRGDLGTPSTPRHPRLEWQVAPNPSPFIHPEGPVMKALAGALAVPPEGPVDHLLRGLVLHAGAQAVRAYVVSGWDHVTIPDGEVEHYMTAFARDDRAAPVLRHLQIVFEVLLKKREYATLVRFAEEAVARRPDVLAFHRTLGKAYYEIRDFENAIEELTLAHALDADHHDVVLELSRALGSAKRWKDAAALLEEERKKSNDPAVLKGLAISVMESGDLLRAKELLDDLNARYPGDVDIMRALDQIERQKK